MKLLPVIAFATLCAAGACTSHTVRTSLRSAENAELKLPYAQTALTAEFVGPVIDDTTHYVWCFSPLATDDGKVHAMVSQWPVEEGMDGWYGPNAEIAHYVADRPEGPFRYVSSVVKTALFPDPSTMAGPHNPRLEYVDGKYVLLYICQNPTGGTGQRIGMMTADSAYGPWHFAGSNDGIMVETSDDPNHWTYGSQTSIGTDNPAFLKIDGKYYIYFKAGTPNHMDAKYGYAVSDSLEGPYTMCDAPITDNVSYLEDAQAFEMDGKYYLLTTDNLGGNTGGFGYLILWESADGRQFKLSDAKIALGTLFDYWGTPADRDSLLATPNLFIRCYSGKMERPAILKVNGKPAYLYGAGDVNIKGRSMSEPYCYRIKWK